MHIYNRYDKLVSKIALLSSGWDGAYNGKIMPSDNYWYNSI
ncbi:T9SS type B sorting domain-containing protein [Polaribacter irgensii]